MLSRCFIFEFLWLQVMSDIYFICLWDICIFSSGNCLNGFSSPPNTRLLNRKQHRKPAAWSCCHRASAHVFEVECWTGFSYSLSSSLFWLFSLQSSPFTAYVSLKYWSPSKHFIAPGCRHGETWNFGEKGTIWSKLVLSILLWEKKIHEVSPYDGPLPPTAMF